MDCAISFVIPTYNERNNITPLLERLHSSFTNCKYEVVFVDDNSRDGTAELISSLVTKYPVRVIVRKDKRGLASAVVDGFGYASYDIIGVMDADLQHPPELAASLAQAIEGGADLAIASRYVKGGSCEGWSGTRKIISRGAIVLSHIFLPMTRRVSDPMSGFFMLRRGVITGVELKPTGYKILLEILVMGKPQHVAEVPYTFKTRTAGESKLSSRTQLDYLKHIYSLMQRTGSELLRFIKFAIVGLTGYFVNQGFLLLFYELVKLPLGVASPISIEIAIISNFVMNDYFTFADRRTGGIPSFLGRLGKFNLVCSIGAAINYLSVLGFTDKFGLHYLISNTIGIALATLWNYFLNRFWTWKK
jgi:dolichol-phosphate mannosyltransferase